jgi:hypothetical protein
LIVTDMIALARNRAMSDAVLLSGDEDLRVGVQQAQEFGVRVHLLGVRPSRGSQSLFLMQEADTTHEWGPDDLKPFLMCEAVAERQPAAPQPAPVVPVAPGAAVAAVIAEAAVEAAAEDDPFMNVAAAIAKDVAESELQALVASIEQSGQIPKQLDGRLLAKGRSALNVAFLDSPQRKRVRAAFLRACRTRADAVQGGA